MIKRKFVDIAEQRLRESGHFMQVIEGEEQKITELYHVIQKDNRHKKLDILRSGHIQYREFPNWSMGFQNLESFDTSKISGFSQLLENDFHPEYFQEHVSEAHALLLAFKEDTKAM